MEGSHSVSFCVVCCARGIDDVTIGRPTDVMNDVSRRQAGRHQSQAKMKLEGIIFAHPHAAEGGEDSTYVPESVRRLHMRAF